MKRLWVAEMAVCLREQFWLQNLPDQNSVTFILIFLSPAFQGGAEHNVPVVISKIFKDQVGKKVFYLTIVAWPLERFTVLC